MSGPFLHSRHGYTVEAPNTFRLCGYARLKGTSPVTEEIVCGGQQGKVSGACEDHTLLVSWSGATKCGLTSYTNITVTPYAGTLGISLLIKA